MRKLIVLLLAMVMVFGVFSVAHADDLIKVGVVNNPPSESGYREANVNDFANVFTKENGYDAKFFYSIKNDEQLAAARQFITDGVDYLLISAAETTGWDVVLKDAKDAGVRVFLFDRMINCDKDLFEAAVVSDMAEEGRTAVNWLLAQNLPEYNVIHIQGAMGSDAQLGRTGALDEQFAAGTMKKVVQQTATWDEAEAKKITEAVINSGEKFNGRHGLRLQQVGPSRAAGRQLELRWSVLPLPGSGHQRHDQGPGGRWPDRRSERAQADHLRGERLRCP